MRSINRLTIHTHGFILYDKHHPLEPSDLRITDHHLFVNPKLVSFYKPIYPTRQEALDAMQQVFKVLGDRAAIYSV